MGGCARGLGCLESRIGVGEAVDLGGGYWRRRTPDHLGELPFQCDRSAAEAGGPSLLSAKNSVQKLLGGVPEFCQWVRGI